MDENINLTILNEINKGAKMGMDSITYVSEKLEQEDMKEELSAQYSGYGKIVEKVNQLFIYYAKISKKIPQKKKTEFISFSNTYFLLFLLINKLP